MGDPPLGWSFQTRSPKDQLVADTIWGRARDGSYVDSVRFTGRTITDHPFATERPGVYDVAVGATGYRTWERRGVRVRDGGCHVKSVSLSAKLQRIS
jgi:hypothetical protein